eukprot:scaffold674_cov126-Cylindrotheca_fusiformis.AAC.17
METDNIYKGLIYGGIASCAAEVFCIPVDVVKTRLQMDGTGGHQIYRGSLHCARKVVAKEGPTALFRGLEPALLRQATYGSIRYGLYTPIRNALGVEHGTPKEAIPFWKKFLAGGAAGALASLAANPTDLVKVRLQTDGQLKKKDGSSRPKRYTGVTHAFFTIIREEGMWSLWNGVGPTVSRATILAAAELGTYDEIKGRLLATPYFEDDIVCVTLTSSISGFFCTLASSPFDVMKSRVMGQPVNKDGTGRYYRGMTDCFFKVLKKEGIMSFYNGFWPNFGYIAPHVVISFIAMEFLKSNFG